MRVFIAIPFSFEVKEYLNGRIQKLREKSKRGNFTRPQNLHLTLAFIGEIQPELVPKILGILDQVTKNRTPFDIELGGLGKFINRGERLYWCGIGENQALNELQRELVSNLQENEIQVDNKPFKPHVTLGRRCIMDRTFNEQEFTNNDTRMEMKVTTISLMKSEQVNGKLTYTSLGDIRLNNR